MSFFTEDFSSYSVGSTPTDPPWKQLGLGSRVTASGLRGRGLQFQPSGGIRHIDAIADHNQITLYYYFKFSNTGSYNSVFLELLNGNPVFVNTDPPPIMLFRLGFEADGTITAITAGKFLGNSGSYSDTSVYADKWYMLQIDVDFTVVGVFVATRCTVTLDGKKVIDSGGYQVSNQRVDGLFNSDTTINYFDFRDQTTQSFIDEITINDGLDPVPSYPNPDAARNLRDTQHIIEYSELPADSAVRITQGIIEWGELPDDSRIRISGMVIELAATPVARRGWKVREC